MKSDQGIELHCRTDISEVQTKETHSLTSCLLNCRVTHARELEATAQERIRTRRCSLISTSAPGNILKIIGTYVHVLSKFFQSILYSRRVRGRGIALVMVKFGI